MTRAIAVDWSGAKSGASSKIWLAEVRDGRLARLESGRDRGEWIRHLIDDAAADSDVVVGLDFGFSFPLWFAEHLGATSIEELWDIVSTQGEGWLSSCPPPFWGRPGKGKPKLRHHFRHTEREVSGETGSNPKSVFQIGGGGAVGTGSIRGMPHLATLRAAGFSIWPFHEVRMPLVIEIYPRLLTGPVNKSDFDARQAYLDQGLPEIEGSLACKAMSSEDAFDAAVSAVVMGRHVDDISALTAARDETKLMEGMIWWPRETREATASSRGAAVQKADCPFCDVPRESVVAESRHALAVEDRYPVSRGHTLVVPREHTETFFARSDEVQADIWSLVSGVRARLQAELNPDGFNVGINEGRAGGQTVGHAHIHVIPRFKGDVADPRGGIRWVLPEHAAYWDS
ncbi:MAG: HIT domain-containing protein [Gemmatimonadota bacterium]|uniref:HIT domain-containing protein n=1 Tax=Candidatus Palauibacter scopulicola TaxID=3056741 RepID=UPI002387DEF1|nr:HIT domain-containing protein [Candidatus Palauibacter scopulicola]MDE2662191.1 HIT domain-containing protein [Candidatus Palauibacter scopulicola]